MAAQIEKCDMTMSEGSRNSTEIGIWRAADIGNLKRVKQLVEEV